MTMRDTATVTRRQALVGLLGVGAVGVAAGVTGCAGSAAGSTPPIQVWDLFSGADGVKMQTMIKAVQAAHPGLDVKPITLAWGSPYYTKLAMASAGRRPPDAAIMHVSRLAGYAPGGLLEPWDLNLLAELGVRPADFAEGLWQRCQYDGQLYALPLDTHPVIAVYNKDIAAKAGVLDSSGLLVSPTTPDAMLDLDAKLGEAVGSGGNGIAFGHLLDTAQSWRLFWGLYNQTGGVADFQPGHPATLDRDKAVQVLTFIQKLLNGPGGHNNYDYAAALAAFNGKRAGLILTGEWELNGLQKAVPNLGAVPMPTLFGTAASYADSHAFVLPRSLTSDPARKRATYTLIAGILKQAYTWAKAGHIPALSPVRQTPEYKALKPQADYAKAIDSVVLDPPVWYAGAGSDFQNQMCQAMQGVMVGQAKPVDAVTKMLSAASALAAKPNPA